MPRHARPGRDEPGELGAAPRGPVHDRDPGGTGRAGLDGDRPGRTTRSQDDDLEPGRVDDGASDSTKPWPSVLWPTSLSVGGHDGVDRSDDLGRLREAVEVVDDRDLVRSGAVETGPAHRPRPADGVPRHRAPLAVEVARVDAVVAVGGLHHDETVGLPAAGDEKDPVWMPRKVAVTRRRPHRCRTG